MDNDMNTAVVGRRADTVSCYACDYAGPWSEYLQHAAGHALPHPDDREAWLRARRTFVGASEVAAVAGLSRWSSALDIYAAKVRGVHRQAGGRARMGLVLEPALLDDYARRHGVTLARPATQRHPEHPYLGATPDGVVEARRRAVQIKVVGARSAHEWADGPPAYYLAQVQVEMEVFDLDDCHVTAMIDCDEPQDYLVERDEAAFAEIAEIVGEFWSGSVVPQVPPVVVERAPDAETLRALYPAVRSVVRPATPEERELVERYKALGEELAPIEAEKEAVAARIKAAIGEAEGFEWPGGKATWKPSKGSVDARALAAALLEAYVPEAERAEWEARHTRAGERRLYTNIKRR